MNYKKALFVPVLVLLSFPLFAQNDPVYSPTVIQSAEKELAISLSGDKINNIIHPKSTLIKTSKTAVLVAEPLLFSIYGEKTILNQKPYEVHHINNYWVIRGTANKNVEGSGRFLIVLDDRDARVIRMDYLR